MNAKEEFLKTIDQVKSKVKCANIVYTPNYNRNVKIYLPVNYTKDQYEEFLHKLDFTYDNGYGGELIFGNIWFNNGTWCDRGEYDGSEWWNYQKCPKIPTFLK